MQDVIDGIGREAVQSSNIASIGYDLARQTLAVEFKSGDVFHYAGVADELALEFYNSESKGKFFHARIRGKFAGKMMTGPCSACGINGVVGTKCTDCGCGSHVDKPRPAKRDDESARTYV